MNPRHFKAASDFAAAFEKGMGDLFRALGADRAHFLSVQLKSQQEGPFLYESEYELIAMPEYDRKGNLLISSLPDAPIIIHAAMKNAEWLDLVGKVIVGILMKDLSPIEAEKLYRKLLTRVADENEIVLDTFNCRLERQEKGRCFIEFCSDRYDEKIQKQLNDKVGSFREEDFDFVQIMDRGITQEFLNSFPDIKGKLKPSGNAVYNIHDKIRIVADDGLVTGVRIEDLCNFQIMTIHVGEDEGSAINKLFRYLVNVHPIAGSIGYNRKGFSGDAAFHDHVYKLKIGIFSGMVSEISLIKQV